MPFMLRRTKDQVLKDLPPKIIQDIYCDLSPMQHWMYANFERSQAATEVQSKIGKPDFLIHAASQCIASLLTRWVAVRSGRRCGGERRRRAQARVHRSAVPAQTVQQPHAGAGGGVTAQGGGQRGDGVPQGDQTAAGRGGPARGEDPRGFLSRAVVRASSGPALTPGR
jgi:hypothetical protein